MSAGILILILMVGGTVGMEFSVLRSIIEGSVLLPLQLSVQVHVHKADNTAHISSFDLLQFSNYMYDFGGYNIIHRADHPDVPTVRYAHLVCSVE